MTSLTESFNTLNYTPLYKNKQNERGKLKWRLLFTIFCTVCEKGFNRFCYLQVWWGLECWSERVPNKSGSLSKNSFPSGHISTCHFSWEGKAYVVYFWRLHFQDKKRLGFRILVCIPQVWKFFILLSSLIHIPQVYPFFKLLAFCLLGLAKVLWYCGVFLIKLPNGLNLLLNPFYIKEC